MIRSTLITLACQRALLTYLVGGQLFLIGCGGTSQSDMRRHAIRRTSNEQETDSVSPAAGSHKASGTPPQASQSPVVSGQVAKLPAGDAVANKVTSADGAKLNRDSVTTQSDVIPSTTAPTGRLSPAERRQRTANNLTQIGEAWRAFLRNKRYFPGPVVSASKQPLLSWRVDLLPYLGLQTLYDAFHLDEAWDSPHNVTLLDKIPVVFQSPDRFDTETNYLALSLGGTTVYQERRKLAESNVEDGIENTLAIVEADDASAVPWTQPAEFPLDMAAPLKSLGNLRENGLFVVWSNGKASWIDETVSPQLFAKACTIDSGDGFNASQIASDLAVGVALPVKPSSEAAGSERIASVAEQSAADTIPATVQTRRPTLSDARASLKSKSQDQLQPVLEKKPIPSASDLKIARNLLRELYQADYAAAQSAPQRLQLARKMLDHLPDLGEDIPGQYALLEIVTQISVQDGGVDHALDAADQMTAHFELQDDAWLDAFEKLARTARDRRAQGRLLEEADDAFNDFVLSQQFGAAERLSQLAVSTANKLGDQEAIAKFTTRRQWASEAKSLRKAAEEALATLELKPDDPRANCDVGKFLCLIKNDWENGLAILANGHDRSLKRLAAMELGELSDPMRRLELADLWWREAESASAAFKTTMQSRAKYWYEQTLPGLPAGLVRIRVERRIEALGKDRPST